MKIFRISQTALIFILSTGCIFAPKKDPSVYLSGITVRNKPDMKSEIVYRNIFRSKVRLHSFTDAAVTINGKEGKWIRVSRKKYMRTNHQITKYSGWVFITKEYYKKKIARTKSPEDKLYTKDIIFEEQKMSVKMLNRETTSNAEILKHGGCPFP
ncbi:MAG: hypothetical protein OEZ34_15085 [Spirochaetia bacterium]|nr:hypothetical protein [Spirochaetia bacterium]